MKMSIRSSIKVAQPFTRGFFQSAFLQNICFLCIRFVSSLFLQILEFLVKLFLIIFKEVDNKKTSTCRSLDLPKVYFDQDLGPLLGQV